LNTIKVNVGGKLVSEEAMDGFIQINFKLASFIEENNIDTNTNVSVILALTVFR
jgi:hypothetical protein